MRTLALFGLVIVAAGSGSPHLGAQNAGVSPALYADLTWRCTGPFDGGPIASIQGVAGEPGVYTITTPSGGEWKTIDGGDSWAPLGTTPNVPPGPLRWVDPANQRRIARVGDGGIEVSLDAGATWTTFRHIPIAEVARLTPRERPVEPANSLRHINGEPATVSIADPVRAGLVFAGTKTGVFVSFDGGANWTPLQSNMPVVAINDLDLRGRNLVAATQGRSIWVLDDITPLRQMNASLTSAPATLFKPADATLPRLDTDAATDSEASGAYLDYYLGAAARGAVTIEVLDAAGRVVHRAESAAPDANDKWLPVMRPLPASAGHHRVVWNLRFDPPPSPHHRFAQFARSLFEGAPAEPDGPMVLAGSYRVRLTVGTGGLKSADSEAKTYVQSLVVKNDLASSTASLQARRQQFDLAIKTYDAMQVAHRGFLQLARARADIRGLLTSSDPDIAQAATDLDARLNVIDGSDWTGLIIPDAPDENPEIEEEEEFVKHPDFVPPKPVSLSKDYDDPTTIFGRRFENVTHAPAFAILGNSLGGELKKVERDTTAPDALAVNTYAKACEQLAGVLVDWRAINAKDIPALNVELARKGLPRVTIAPSVPSIACAPAK